MGYVVAQWTMSTSIPPLLIVTIAMPARKRTKAQREEELLLIAEMHGNYMRA
jgi:hypothetical protein